MNNFCLFVFSFGGIDWNKNWAFLMLCRTEWTSLQIKWVFLVSGSLLQSILRWLHYKFHCVLLDYSRFARLLFTASFWIRIKRMQWNVVSSVEKIHNWNEHGGSYVRVECVKHNEAIHAISRYTWFPLCYKLFIWIATTNDNVND